MSQRHSRKKAERIYKRLAQERRIQPSFKVLHGSMAEGMSWNQPIVKHEKTGFFKKLASFLWECSWMIGLVLSVLSLIVLLLYS